MNILYIHNLGGSKIDEDSKLIEKITVDTNNNFFSLDLPFNPVDAVMSIEKIIKKNKIDVLIGFGLGGFYALCSSIVFKDLKIFLFNPLLVPCETLKTQKGYGIKEYEAVRENKVLKYVLDDDFYHSLKGLESVLKQVSKNENYFAFFNENNPSDYKIFEKYGKSELGLKCVFLLKLLSVLKN